MINLKVKTLDSLDFSFSVEDDITVHQFKEHIAEKINVAADLQRLIYCGRVLNDEKLLKEYDVNGKVVHLVQRPPPSARPPNNNTSSSTPGSNPSTRRHMRTRALNVNDFENMMMGSFALPFNATTSPPTVSANQAGVNFSSTLCMNRITVALHMLKCAENIAAYLENPEVGLNNTAMDLLSQQTMESTVFEVGISAVTDSDIPQQQVQNIVQAFQGAVSAAFRQNGLSNITVQQNNDSVPGIQVFGTAPTGNTTSSTTSISIPINLNDLPNLADMGENQSSSSSSTSTSNETSNTNAASTNPRQQTTSTQTLAEVVQKLRAIQQRLDPFIQQYYDILQNDPQYSDDDPTSRENAQRVFDRVSEALHYLSHAQHAISDLMLDLSSNTPRVLCCRPILVEQSAFVRSGIAAVPQFYSASGPPPFLRTSTNNNNNNNINNNNNNNSTSADTGETQNGTTNTTSSAPRPNPQPASEMDGQNESLRQQGLNRGNVDRFLQSLVNAVQPNTEVHIINANFSANPVSSPTTATSNTTSTTTTSTACPLHTDSGTTTQPTSSTPTRTTPRPQMLTSTTLPATSIRNLRPIPANVLSSFDRFLPCNSHHIRDNNQQSSQNNQQTRQTQTSAPRSGARFRTESLDRSPLLPASVNISFRDLGFVTGRNSLRGIRNITNEEYNRTFNMFGIQFALQDIDRFNHDYLNGIRQELRSHLLEKYFGGDSISEENMENGVLKIITALEKYTNRLKTFNHPDYDVLASLNKLLRQFLPEIIKLINDDSVEDFGNRVERQLLTFCENFYMILVKCIGQFNAETYLNEVANIAMIGSCENTGSFARFPRHLIQTYLVNQRSYDLSEIQEFLVQIQKPLEVKEEVSMDVDSEVTVETSEEKPTETEVSMETTATNNDVQEDDLMNDPLPLVVEGTEPWHSLFPTEWLPVISRDIARQARQSFQAPYSDAYISGMSSKRRKLLQSKKPPVDAQQLLNESLVHAIQTVRRPVASTSSRSTLSAGSNVNTDELIATIIADPQVQSSYRDTIRGTVRDRVQQDPDYKSEKYPNLRKFTEK